MNVNQNLFIASITISNNGMLEPISSSLRSIVNKVEGYFKKLNDYGHDQEELDILINKILESLNGLEDTLRQIDSLSDEFNDFYSIKFTISYILSNGCFFEEDFEDKFTLMTSILMDFFDIVLSKEYIPIDDYNELYDDFIFRLDDWEQLFYTQIYKPSKNYDEEALKQICYDLLN